MISIGDIVSVHISSDSDVENEWGLGIVIDCEDILTCDDDDVAWDDIFYQIMLANGDIGWFLLSHVRMIF